MATRVTPIVLRVFPSKDLNSYAVSAKEFQQALHPFKKKEADFFYWLQEYIVYYGFEEGLDFEREKEDFLLTVDMAKEVARIERTEQGREVRYYLLAFEYELTRQGSQEPFDKTIQQLNQFVESIKVGQEAVVILTCDLMNLIQAIRQYQYLTHFYATPDNDINPVWVNRLIDNIKQTTGKNLIDEDV